MDEAHVAFGAEVGLRILRLDELLLGRLDRAEHRGVALAGAVDADAEVDLVGARIGVVELDQREERVGGLLGEVVEHGGALMPHGSRASASRSRRAYRRAVIQRLRTAASAACARTSCSRR